LEFGIWNLVLGIFTKVTFQCDPGSNNYICHREPAESGRGDPVCCGLRPSSKNTAYSFQRFTAARVLKEDFIFFSTSSPCSLEIALSPWLLAKTTKTERGDPVTFELKT
jgi:hypothetical protein